MSPGSHPLPPRRWRPLVVALLLLALAALTVAPETASGAAPGLSSSSSPSRHEPTAAAHTTAARLKKVERTRRLVVRWQGFRKHPTYVKSADVPGIGHVDLVCQPQSTMLRIHVQDRSRETQLWMAKFETKNGRDVVAVKNVRVYTWSTAADNGRGGTGSVAHEGLNQRSPIEDFEKGSAYGVISQRPGRNRPGGGRLSVPATSFRLTWYWERFAYPGSQFCKMTLALHTDTDQQFGLNWHGDSEAAKQTESRTTLPGLGEAVVRCETGRDGAQTVGLVTDDPKSFMDYEYVSGEGPVEDHVITHRDLDRDPVTGMLGPVPLPRNGVMRLWFDVHGVKRAFVLSSYVVTNNARHPDLNLCEVAAAPLP